MDDMPYSPAAGAPEPEAPMGIERRMVFRFLTYWRAIAGESRVPPLGKVVPADISDTWPHCFIVDLGSDGGGHTIRAVGETLAQHWTADLTGAPVSDLPEGTLIREAVSYLDEIIRKRVPISRGGEFTQYDGRHVLYRSILLPMSSADDESMDVILGAANCRIVVE